MDHIPLPWPDAKVMFALPFADLPLWARWSFVSALVLVPLALLLMLYRYELRLVSRLTATLLLGLRLCVYGLVVLLVCTLPTYARDSRYYVPGRVVVVLDRSASMDVTDPHRGEADKLALARALGMAKDIDAKRLDGWIADHRDRRAVRWLAPDEPKDSVGQDEIDRRMKTHDELCRRVDDLTRSAIADHILGKDGTDVLGRLAGRHNVELLVIDRDVREAKDLARATRGEGAGYTDLNGPLARALEGTGTRGDLLGVVVLTDGRHNSGKLPSEKADELGQRKIPIYPVALGEARSPPDLAVVSVRGPNHTVFKDVETGVDVNFKATGLPAQDLLVEVWREGKDRKLLASKSVAHDGKDRYYAESFPMKMEDVGTQTVTATVRPARPDPGHKEAIADNNSLATTIAVADDRAKVLVVDGEARWEFHYLATALQRDRLVDLKTVVFEQPRLEEKTKEEDLEKAGLPGRKWPEGEDALSAYSCVVLGDVDPDKLPAEQRKRLEKYVADAGGTLIVIAGKRAMPLAYPDRDKDGQSDPLRRLLPIEAPAVLAPEAGFSMALTAGGREMKFTELDPDREDNDLLWKGFPRPWGWAVAGVAKPGAVSLARVPGANEDALTATERDRRGAVVARHNYGFGRVLYVGIDSTWRWRYKTGDQYHHKFWGQVVRWAAADRPLAVGNETVRFGTPQPVYRPGEVIDLVARLDEKAGPLPAELSANARLVRLPDEKAGAKEEAPVALVPLDRRAAQPRILEGKIGDLTPGKYAVELAVAGMEEATKDKDGKPLRLSFTVLPTESKETAELGMNEELLKDLAARTGGRVYTPLDAGELAERLKKAGTVRVEHDEQHLWQWWPVLVVIVALPTMEWVGRKLAGLP